MKHKKPKILVIGTGGTISAKPHNGAYKYGESTQEEVINMIPELRERFDIDTTNLFRMDSADMEPAHWLTLANTIYYKMKDYDGIVVSMGTDTMHYADTATAFLIQNNNIPIVFTSSLIDPTQINTDAKRNLKNAIYVAATADIAETIVVFNGNILRATRTKKVNASEFDAFRGSNNLPLGRIEYLIKFNKTHKKRSNNKPKLYTKLETQIGMIKVYPGYNGERLKRSVDYGLKGIILEGFGLGNLPLMNNSMKDAIKYANKKNVPIIITSDCFVGRNWRELYKADIGARLKGLKVIPVYDMLTETAYVKLMWVLAQTQEFSEIKKMMQKNYCGEISDDLTIKKVI
ncbi:MAG: asparaginase [archaeon]|nr:asparaginase [archaeon]